MVAVGIIRLFTFRIMGNYGVFPSRWIGKAFERKTE